MNTLEFAKSDLHNRHIEFSYKGKPLTGVVIDIIPHRQKKTHTEYLYIPSKNLIAWRKAETENNVNELNKLSRHIDISNIEWGRPLPMNKNEVEMRIQDWRNRIKELFDNFKEWSAESLDCLVKIQADQEMYEEMMKQFDVKPQKLFSADIYRKGKLIMTFKPAGLWLIGANGKIDILSKSGAKFLVDRSFNYRKPDWKIYLSHDNKSQNELTKSIFLKLISE
jgi:hypothetical protein